MGNTLGKAFTMLFWLVALYNVISPFPGAYSTWINVLAILLLVAHAAECLYFRRFIQRDHAANPLAGYVLVLLFGVLHSGKWLKEQKQSEA